MNQHPNTPQPPRWADQLLEWFCAPHLLEELQGDLHEEFYYQVERIGERRARQRYIWDVLGFIRPFAIKRKSSLYPSTPIFPFDMLKSYVTIALRTLWRNKGYAAINSIGLSVAFCICTFLFLTAYFQLSFNSFHQDQKRIFQTYFFKNAPEKIERMGNMPLPLTPALKAEYEDVEGAARVMEMRKSTIEYKGKFVEKDVTLTDPDFFQIFSFPLIKGNSKTVLMDLRSIVITKTMAQILFGKEDPMGKVLQIGGEGNQKGYIVSGVSTDVPENSSIRFDALIRVENLPNYQATQNQWDAFSHKAFVKLAPHVDQKTFENRLKPFAQKYLTAEIESLKNRGAKPDKNGDIFAIRLQNLSKVHFDTDISSGPPIAMVYAIIGIGLFILFIACINFVNLSIARSFTRAREVGVRKTLGALKGQLFVQIWGESTLLCFIGFVVGLLLTYVLLPEFNAAFGAKFTISYMLQPQVIALLFGLFVLVTLVAGGYPALQMAAFHPVEVLKGKISLKRPGVLRNSLIVAQFAMSALLACCSVIAFQQVNYMRQKPLGFEKEQVISIPVGSKANGRQVLQRMRNKLASDPAIVSITGTGVNLGRGKDGTNSRSVIGFNYKGKEVASDWLLVDYDYIKTLQIPLLGGREFDPAYPSDSLDRVVITQSMADMIGEKEPVGKFFQTDTAGAKIQIIGVVPDFHLYSLANEIKPITMHLSHSEPIHYIFVRVAPASLSASMDKMKEVWKEVAPGTEFIGSFLDENIEAWYRDVERLFQIFGLASFVAILLSCSGLFAVALLVIEQRTKEIGIRKVLGASIPAIIFVLSKDFIKLVLIALAIAIPLAWFFMQQWLNEYPYQIEISIWIFIGVGIAATLIALLTVGYQSIKAALANPVKALRSE